MSLPYVIYSESATPSSSPLSSDSENDDSSPDSDDSTSPHISAPMLAVTSTICVLIVVSTAILIFFLVRRRRIVKHKPSPVMRRSLGRSTLSSRSGTRGSRGRNFGRPSSVSSTSTYDVPKHDIYELDSHVVEALHLHDHRNGPKDLAERFDPESLLPPPYGMKMGE